jgi:hypothetical protein
VSLQSLPRRRISFEALDGTNPQSWVVNGIDRIPALGVIFRGTSLDRYEHRDISPASGFTAPPTLGGGDATERLRPDQRRKVPFGSGRSKELVSPAVPHQSEDEHSDRNIDHGANDVVAAELDPHPYLVRNVERLYQGHQEPGEVVALTQPVGHPSRD